jgi:hypothetical protein
MSFQQGPDDLVADMPSVQRTRVHEGVIPIAPLSLDDINDNSILEIFQYLSVEILNSIVVFISSRYRDLRNHNSLNQTRTGTIVCTDNTTVKSFRDNFVAKGWNRVFTGNRTRLKVIIGLEKMRGVPPFPGMSIEPMYLLPNVSSLDISGDPLAVSGPNIVWYIANMVPNLEEAKLSHMALDKRSVGLDYLFYYLKARKIICNGMKKGLSLDFMGCSQITELHLDDSQLFSTLDAHMTRRAYSDGRRYMFRGLTNIVSLSIRNVTFCERRLRERRESTRAFPITQKMIIKMVRLHPTLRWLRSDLTEASIAKLQHERPEITFW